MASGYLRPGVPDLYLLHFEPRYEHAQHYLGYAKGLGRGRTYAEGIANGTEFPPQALPLNALASGREVIVADVFVGASRDEQRRMRRNGSLSRFCSVCRERGKYHR